MDLIKPESWMLQKPIDVFFFDCDSTLSLIEGIDELAEINGVGEAVKAMTHKVMAITGLTLESYKQRLEYVKPTQEHIELVAEMYREYRTPGALESIQALQALDKKIYILSAGIRSSLIPLANDLGIPEERILAVDVYFDDLGQYAGFDERSNLIKAEGKNRQIEEVVRNNETSFLIGDGLSDWEARTTVTRFVGFGGVSPKSSVQDHSDLYINCPSLFSVIPLGLTYEEQLSLPVQYRSNYEKGLAEILNGHVLIKE